MWIWASVAILASLVVAAIAAAVCSIFRQQAKPTADPILGHGPLRLPCRFEILKMQDAFEPDAASIWEPQIEILRLITERGEQGIQAESLRPRFLQMAIRFPELYEGVEYQDWLESLERQELISYDEGRICVTDVGTAFLRHRLELATPTRGR